MNCGEIKLKDPQKLYEFLRYSVSACTELARSLRFDKTHKWHVNLLLLYGSVLEIAASICILIEEKSPIGIPILLRSMLEAFLDFNNLKVDRNYGYRMDATHIKEWIKLLKASKDGNPYLVGLTNSKNIVDVLSDYEKQFEELINEGYKPLQVFEKFKLANLNQEYLSFYNCLCCDTHNNIRSLILRHADITVDQTDYQLQFFSPSDLNFLVVYIDSCISILIDITEMLHKTFESQMIVETEKLVAQFAEIRKPWQLE